MDDKLLTIDEAALLLQNEARTIQSWIDRGLPTFEAGDGTRLIRRADLDAFLRREGQGASRDAAEEGV